MSNDVSITFEYASSIIRDPLSLGSLEQGEQSLDYLINIKHNSNKPIRDCVLFLSEYDGIYNSSNSAYSDLNKLIWYADNYVDKGLSISQEYTIFGEIFLEEGERIIDVSLDEEKDFMSGFYMEIISGPISGERVKVSSYDPANNLFIMADEFSIPVEGERYKIEINSLDYIKSKSGTNIDNGIPLLFRGGRIDRFESASITLKLSVPSFSKMPGISHINFNMKHTPEQL